MADSDESFVIQRTRPEFWANCRLRCRASFTHRRILAMVLHDTRLLLPVHSSLVVFQAVDLKSNSSSTLCKWLLASWRFGSLIDNPGAGIEAALVGRKLNVRTPFSVEFARSSNKRGGAPNSCPSRMVANQSLLKFCW